MVVIHAEYRGDRWHDICGGPYWVEFWYDDKVEEWHDDDFGGTYSDLDCKKQIISLATVSLLWLGSLPSLPPMYAKSSLVVFEERLTRLMNMDSSVGDNNRILVESWYLWKASDHFYQRCNFRVAVFFDASFFTSSFYLLFSATSLYWDNLAAVRYISKLESGFLLEVSSFTNIAFVWFSIIMNSFFLSWIRMTVRFLTASYNAARRIIFLDDCCVPFARIKTIGSSVLVTCNSIVATGDLFWIIGSGDLRDRRWLAGGSEKPV